MILNHSDQFIQNTFSLPYFSHSLPNPHDFHYALDRSVKKKPKKSIKEVQGSTQSKFFFLSAREGECKNFQESKVNPPKVVSKILRSLEFIAPLHLIYLISYHIVSLFEMSGNVSTFWTVSIISPFHQPLMRWLFPTNPPHLRLLDVLSCHQLLTRPGTCLSPWNQMKELHPFAAITKGLLHT